MTERATIEVTGLVQGVGFRPFVYSLATALHLRGFVQNRGGHVFVDVEGESSALHTFIDRLTIDSPQPAVVDRLQCRAMAPANHERFVIAGSSTVADAGIRVPADAATCDACLEELFDPGNRRHRHPFITCTTCGPRYSIVTGLPYDRSRTSMHAFAMCDLCRSEYRDPRDRRFHAQAIACPRCGPSLVASGGRGAGDHGEAALDRAATMVREGGIVAVKGLGGFHLACDATNPSAVAELRRRKGREARPFAVMVPDATGRRIAAAAGRAALTALTSRERPIVLLPKRALPDDLRARLADNLDAGCPALGLLLPYTPVHHLLLADLERPLVMTSGNHSDEPMACDDEAAAEQLATIADLFLTHNRRITTRCDDSVVQSDGDRVSPVRRARGYTPSPILLAEQTPVTVLAVGGHLKNTVTMAARHHAYLSQHIGSLESPASHAALGETVSHLSRLLGLVPEVIAHDLHPDYRSTRFAMDSPTTRRIAVQHHHAHVLSCVAEHGWTEPVIGVAFDGAGYGTDGATWGGEFLVVDGIQCRRAAHLAYVALPGGDAAARQPWRMAVAHLAAAFGPDLGPPGDAIAGRVAADRFNVATQMIRRGVCAPPTSSAGRLFDAVASLLGLRDTCGFEGQAAMELEAIADPTTPLRYRFEYDTAPATWTVDAAPVIRDLSADVMAGRMAAQISSAFHESIGYMIGDVAARISNETGIRCVALTGGVFQNALLRHYAERALHGANLTVLEHRLVPCNDGGLSLGQALFAMRVVNAAARSGVDPVCA